MQEDNAGLKLTRRNSKVLNGLGLFALIFVLATVIVFVESKNSGTEEAFKQTRDWCSEYCYITNQIPHAAAKIGIDSDSHNWNALATDSQSLVSDVSRATVFPAIPNTAAAAHFDKALTYFRLAAQDYANGAHYAQNGSVDNDSSLTNLASAEVDSGNSMAQQGAVQIQDTVIILSAGK